MLQVGASICVIVQVIWDTVGPVKCQKLGFNLHSGAEHFSDSIFRVNVVSFVQGRISPKTVLKLFGNPHPLK